MAALRVLGFTDTGKPALHASPGLPGGAPDEAMLADFLGGDLASPEDARALFGGRLETGPSAGSQASPWASDADAQCMLPLERMLDMLGQQPQPGAHHAALLLKPRARSGALRRLLQGILRMLHGVGVWAVLGRRLARHVCHLGSPCCSSLKPCWMGASLLQVFRIAYDHRTASEMLSCGGLCDAAGAEDGLGQLQSSCSEACITATSSATEVCLEAAAPWPPQELEAGGVRDGPALLPPPPPLGDAAPCARQSMGGGMAEGPIQPMSPRAFQGLELGEGMGPVPGAVRGLRTWGSAVELAACDAPRASLAHRSAPKLRKLSETLASSPASPRAPAQRPHSLRAARTLAQQLLHECGRPSPGSALHQDCERLAAAAAAAVTPTSSAACMADDDDLPVSTPAALASIPLGSHCICIWRCVR